MPPSQPSQPGQPALRVVRGDATAEEIAALVTVLALRRGAPAGPATGATKRPVWPDRSRLMRAPLFPGPAGWRRSALPR